MRSIGKDNDMQRLTGLAPIANVDARLLLLGSMPGAVSLLAQQYYAYAHNHFWQLICAVLNEQDPGTYEDRIAMLLRHNIALWDVIQSCLREGSLDKDIKEAVPNDILSFLPTHPAVKTVCFNGTTAQRMYDKHFERVDGIRYILLPSSSPVPRQKIRTLADKLPAWTEIGQYL